MSRENVELVRQTTDAYNRRDFEAAIKWMDPAIEWDMTRVQVPDPGVYRGLDGVRDFHNSWDESWDWLELEPEEFVDAGDRVVSVMRQAGEGKLSGAEVEQHFAQVWTLRDAKIVRMEMYPSRKAALEAVGLRE